MSYFIQFIFILILAHHSLASQKTFSCTGTENFFNAVFKGHTLIVECLINLKPSLVHSQKTLLTFRDLKKLEKENPLLFSSEEKWIKKFPPNTNVTMAYVAAFFGHYKILKTLLENGALVDPKHKSYGKNLFRAVFSQKKIPHKNELIRLLLDYFIDDPQNTPDLKESSFLFKEQDLYSLLTLVYHFGSFKNFDLIGRSFFSLALEYNWSIEQIEKFLDLLEVLRNLDPKFNYTPNINHLDDYQMTALGRAFRSEKIELAKHFIKKFGANLVTNEARYQSPLRVLIINSEVNVVEAILKEFPWIFNLRDQEGNTTFDLLIEKFYKHDDNLDEELAQVLLNQPNKKTILILENLQGVSLCERLEKTYVHKEKTYSYYSGSPQFDEMRELCRQ